MEMMNEPINLLNETPRETDDPAGVEKELPEDAATSALMIDFAQGAGDVSSDATIPFSRAGAVLGACFLSVVIPPSLLLTGPLCAQLAVKHALPAKKNELVKEEARSSKERPNWQRLGLSELLPIEEEI